MRRLEGYPDISWLLAFSVLFLLIYVVKRPQHYARIAWMMLIFLGMLVAHGLLADIGWFYRYEMYLIGTGVFYSLVVLALFLLEHRSDKRAIPYSQSHDCYYTGLLICFPTS
jgi:hypothetical protein